jgi:hypothetical protein
MELDIITTDDKTEGFHQSENVSERNVEESAISQDSEYDDFLGVPESLNINIHENGEPVSIDKVNENIFDKGK